MVLTGQHHYCHVKYHILVLAILHQECMHSVVLKGEDFN